MKPIVVKGHERPLTQLKYNPDGDLIVTASRDKVVSVWFSSNGERLGTLGPHGGSVMSIDIDRDSRYVVTGSADLFVHFWNLKTGAPLGKISFAATPRYVQLFPYGEQSKLLVVQDQQMGQSGTVFIYDIDLSDLGAPKFEQVAKSESLESPFVKAAWSYDGKSVIAVHRDGSISRINALTGAVELNKPVHKAAITDLQMSGDSSYFITASRDSTAMLMRTDGDFVAGRKTYQGDVPLNAAAIAPVKDIIIAGGGMDARDVTLKKGNGKFEAHFFNKLFADDLGRVGGHFGPINTIAIHPYGTSYASGSEDGLIRIHHFDQNYFEFEYGKTAA